MQRVLLIAAGLCALGALWKAEAEEDGTSVALSPFLGALVIEAAILLLTQKRNTLIGTPF